MKFKQPFAPNQSECVCVRYIPTGTLPALFVCFALGFLYLQCGFALQGGPPGQGNPQDVAVVSSPRDSINLPEGEEEKLADIELAAERGDRQALRTHLQDVDAAVQAAAFNALSASDTPSAVQDLLAIIRDQSNPTRWQALWLLDQSWQVDQQIVMQTFRVAARDSDPLVSDYALQALAARQDPDALPGNIGSPETESQATKLAATQTAASGGDSQTLRQYLRDTDAAVQTAAFDALAAQDTNAAVQDLLADIKDSSMPAREQSLQLLDLSPQVDQATVISALIDALGDSDSSVGNYALQALARRAEPEGMGALTQAFQSSDAQTRLLIINSVAQTDAGLQFLREARSDSDETVRNAAASRLEESTESIGETQQQ